MRRSRNGRTTYWTRLSGPGDNAVSPAIRWSRQLGRERRAGRRPAHQPPCGRRRRHATGDGSNQTHPSSSCQYHEPPSRGWYNDAKAVSAAQSGGLASSDSSGDGGGGGLGRAGEGGAAILKRLREGAGINTNMAVIHQA